jgi:hypothetical protein
VDNVSQRKMASKNNDETKRSKGEPKFDARINTSTKTIHNADRYPHDGRVTRSSRIRNKKQDPIATLHLASKDHNTDLNFLSNNQSIHSSQMESGLCRNLHQLLEIYEEEMNSDPFHNSHLKTQEPFNRTDFQHKNVELSTTTLSQMSANESVKDSTCAPPHLSCDESTLRCESNRDLNKINDSTLNPNNELFQFHHSIQSSDSSYCSEVKMESNSITADHPTIVIASQYESKKKSVVELLVHEITLNHKDRIQFYSYSSDLPHELSKKRGRLQDIAFEKLGRRYTDARVLGQG